MSDERDIRLEEAAAAIARHLDGRGGDLTEAEAEVVEEIRADEAWLGSMMNVSVPEGVLERSYARMYETVALQPRPRSVWRRMGPIAPKATAVAAVIVLATLLTVMFDAPSTGGPVEYSQAAVNEFLDEDVSAFDLQVGLLDDEVTLAWAELALDDEFAGVSELDALAEELGDLWADPAELYDDAEM